MHDQLHFQMVPGSFVEGGDGSLSCNVSCPFQSCNRDFPASFKAYPRYYKRKRGTENTSLNAPRWSLGNVESHVLKVHVSDVSTEFVDSEDREDIPANIVHESSNEDAIVPMEVTDRPSVLDLKESLSRIVDIRDDSTDKCKEKDPKPKKPKPIQKKNKQNSFRKLRSNKN